MSNIYGCYWTSTFNDIFKSYDEFKAEKEFYDQAGLDSGISEKSSQTLFYLLSARYGNSSIANSDKTQFKLKLFSIIFQYGPTWEKRLSIQNTLRSLTEDELVTGAKQINNHSYNPSTAPSTDTLEELPTINEQTSTKYKKSKMDAYSNLMLLLEKDVTEDFLKRFKKLFLIVVEPQEPLWYVTDLEQEE